MKILNNWKALVCCLFCSTLTFFSGTAAAEFNVDKSAGFRGLSILDTDAAGEALPPLRPRAGPDHDGDGIDSDVDTDDDDDRISDIDEGLIDADGDGVPDPGSRDTDGDGVVDGLDADSDNDGIPDFDEAVPNFNPGIFTPVDTDGDGTPDFIDLNSDDDNIYDLVEAGGADVDGDGMVDNFTDTSGKGIDDSLDANSLPVFDTDFDGTHDYRDLDSDNDTIPDLIESGGNPQNSPADTDGDGAADYRESDSDGDGLTDTTEAAGSPNSPPDTDGDGAPDFQDTDSNNDGINDGASIVDNDGDGIADQIDLDDDNDGILDVDEGLVDANGDGIPDASSADQDGDGVPDGIDLDSDNDGIFDLWERSPNIAAVIGLDLNTNGAIDNTLGFGANGLLDALETAADSGAFADPVADTDGDGTADFRDLDSDADGIFDIIEAGGTDADASGTVDGFTDSTGKGVADSIDANNLPVFDTDGDGTRDFRDPDSDNDGILDLVEGGGVPNLPTDTDSDGAADFRETDSDGDSIPDSTEAGSNLSNPVDTDGDGAPDFQDLDSNNDGTQDGVAAPAPAGTDTDGDGVPDAIDLDDDNDGILDVNEGLVDANGDGIPDAASADRDGDGVPDGIDLDSDNDGILDLVERSPNLAAITGVDANGNGSIDFMLNFGANGIYDPLETSPDSGVLVDPLADTDGDGEPDFRDLDSDGDGIFDIVEAGGVDTDASGTVDGFTDTFGKGVDDGIRATALPLFDTDSDGASDFRDLDSDNDGIPDAVEGGGSANQPVDTDGDGAPDFRETDSDGDSIPDSAEAGGNPANPVDTDGDGTPDFQDLDSDNDGSQDGATTPITPAVTGPDTDGDLIPNQIDLDDDNDGIPDTLEGAVDSDNDGVLDASSLDTDGDGTPDAWDLDSDNDGILDNEEARLDLQFVQQLDQVVNGAIDIGVPVGANGLADVIETAPDSGVLNFQVVDTDNDGTPDFQDIDSDNDGINDLVEAGGGDADNDGRIDNFVDADDKGVDDFVQNNALPVFDTDADGLADFRDTDSDNDTIPDSVEAGPVPNQPVDTDGDGAPDYREQDSDGDTLPDNLEAGPNPAQPVDTDQDGLPDFQDIDSDGDSVPDNLEQPTVPTGPVSNDADNDGIPNAVDIDDDNDGILDVNEGSGDSDGDGVANQFDLDSDNDGLFDIQEASLSLSHSQTLDADGNGVVDGSSFGPNGFADAIEDAPESGIPVFVLADTDGDGVSDFLDIDSDNDSIYDVLENGHADANLDGRFDATGPLSQDGVLPGTGGFFLDNDGDNVPDFRDLDSDNDTLSDVLEAQGVDADGDARIDGFTDANGDGGNDAQAASLVVVPDTDGDRIYDFRDLDSDNDGLSDLLETAGPAGDLDNNGEVDNFSDANGDGLDDSVAQSPTLLNDTDGDAFPDFRDLDSDSDGIFDVVEAGGVDGDGDGVVDNMGDSDNDGIPNVVDSDATGGPDVDGDSIDDNFDASVNGLGDLDNDGISDNGDPDADGDGFSGIADDGASSNQNLPDANNNGVLDFQEIDGAINPVPGASNAVIQTGLTGTGFGCAIAGFNTAGFADAGNTVKRNIDPLFLLMLAASAAWFFGRKQRLQTAASKPRRKQRGFLAVATIASSIFLSSCGAFDTGSSGSGDYNKRIYVGVGAGASRLEPDATQVPGVSVSETASAGGQFTLGYDFSNRFSVEAHGGDLGAAEIAPAGEIGYQVGALSGVAYLLNDSFDRGRREGFNLFGRLGVGTLRNQAEVVQFERVNDFHLLTGIGLEYGLRSGLGVRAELISFDEDAQLAQLGLVYRFGSHPARESEPTPRVQAPLPAPEPLPLPAPLPIPDAGPLDSDNDGVEDTLDNCPTTPIGTPVNSSGCALFAGVIEGVNFETGSARLTAEAATILEGVASTLLEFPEIRVTVEAHTDNRGSASSNLELSKQRAISVAKFLVERGVAGSRLQPQAYGESQPRASNADAQGRAANRRVEFNTL